MKSKRLCREISVAVLGTSKFTKQLSWRRHECVANKWNCRARVCTDWNNVGAGLVPARALEKPTSGRDKPCPYRNDKGKTSQRSRQAFPQGRCASEVHRPNEVCRRYRSAAHARVQNSPESRAARANQEYRCVKSGGAARRVRDCYRKRLSDSVRH